MQAQTRRRKAREWSTTDRGMLVLVKLVLADDWSAADAAEHLLRRVRQPEVLARMAARVRVAQSERPSEVGERAVRTLSQARARLQVA